MTRKQIAVIIGLNAVISTVISVVVALIFLRTPQETPVGATSGPAGQVTAALTIEAGVAATPEIVVHTVQAGDTISGLALQYDVPEEEITAANQLENPNFLQVGMQLIIPVGGMPTQAPATLTPAPTPTDTPLPVDAPSTNMTATAAAALTPTDTPLPVSSSGELVIEITEVLGVGQVDQERVIITNLGDIIADMQDWTLSGAGGNVFTFPNARLWKQGAVTVHTGVGVDGSPPSNYYWGRLQPIWSLGDVVTLKDAQGTVLATYTVGQ